VLLFGEQTSAGFLLKTSVVVDVASRTAWEGSVTTSIPSSAASAAAAAAVGETNCGSTGLASPTS